MAPADPEFQLGPQPFGLGRFGRLAVVSISIQALPSGGVVCLDSFDAHMTLSGCGFSDELWGLSSSKQCGARRVMTPAGYAGSPNSGGDAGRFVRGRWHDPVLPERGTVHRRVGRAPVEVDDGQAWWGTAALTKSTGSELRDAALLPETCDFDDDSLRKREHASDTPSGGGVTLRCCRARVHGHAVSSELSIAFSDFSFGRIRTLGVCKT